MATMWDVNCGSCGTVIGRLHDACPLPHIVCLSCAASEDDPPEATDDDE